MTTKKDSLDTLCINTIRFLAVDAINKAKSGHPGLPMGAASMAYALWTGFLRHNPNNPAWPDRDRFVLSAGHGSALIYALLHLTGYDLSLDDLRNFRQWGAKTPGHPEYRCVPGVETTTGPLGQGFANGVGMALAERFLAAYFNRPGHLVVDHHTYGLVSDGDLMEGISHEAASLAGHLRLGKLIYLYDDNHISIEGKTDITFTEDRVRRFEAYGWHVQQVEDGNDLAAVAAALDRARQESGRPSLIAVRTHIGYGSPHKQDTPSVHGSPLGPDETELTRKNLNWPSGSEFFVPEEARVHFQQVLDQGESLENEWRDSFAAYEREYPGLAAEYQAWLRGELPEGWDRDIPLFAADAKGLASRVASGQVLNAIARNLPFLLGGSADLAPSTNTIIKGEESFQHCSYNQRNIRFGVREHGMGGVLNGMALHGGLVPYGATFLVFSDYMRPAMRLAAMMRLKVVYVLTHDSIGLGEDGPTHQPVEHLASLRAMPGLTVIRPADANETAEAWRTALTGVDGPTALILSRQALPTLDRSEMGDESGLRRGAYILKDFGSGRPQVLLIASGSEVDLVLRAAGLLQEDGIAARVVSMPSWELFDAQPESYRVSVLSPDIEMRLAVEAGSTQGWHRYVGSRGKVMGIDHFGASAPAKILFEKFGLTAERVKEEALSLLG